MKIHTFKYDIGDTVYLIRNSPVENWEICPSCAGDGKIKMLDGNYTNCPTCHRSRRGQILKWTKPFWHIEHIPFGLTVGRQEAIFLKEQTEEKYMAEETGIGSGSFYYVSELFPTIEEANAECEKRNSKQGEQQ